MRCLSLSMSTSRCYCEEFKCQPQSLTAATLRPPEENPKKQVVTLAECLSITVEDTETTTETAEVVSITPTLSLPTLIFHQDKAQCLPTLRLNRALRHHLRLDGDRVLLTITTTTLVIRAKGAKATDVVKTSTSNKAIMVAAKDVGMTIRMDTKEAMGTREVMGTKEETGIKETVEPEEVEEGVEEAVETTTGIDVVRMM
jgi:hypothetical protein